MFRHIQFLTVLLNEVQKGTLIVVLIWSSTLILSLVVSMLVISSIEDWTSLATLMLIAVDCTLEILIILGGMSTVYITSRTALETKPKLCSSSDARWLRRFLSSCQPLKIRIGSVNFVDEFTPLNCLHFSITLGVNIILLERNK